jgi:hypothetical protein
MYRSDRRQLSIMHRDKLRRLEEADHFLTHGNSVKEVAFLCELTIEETQERWEMLNKLGLIQQ